jgi:hypothetical protein
MTLNISGIGNLARFLSNDAVVLSRSKSPSVISSGSLSSSSFAI